MNKSEMRNLMGELLTLSQMCEVSNLGASTVRRIANESNSARKIGKSYRINRRIFLDYIEQIYS